MFSLCKSLFQQGCCYIMFTDLYNSINNKCMREFTLANAVVATSNVWMAVIVAQCHRFSIDWDLLQYTVNALSSLHE